MFSLSHYRAGRDRKNTVSVFSFIISLLHGYNNSGKHANSHKLSCEATSSHQTRLNPKYMMCKNATESVQHITREQFRMPGERSFGTFKNHPGTPQTAHKADTLTDILHRSYCCVLPFNVCKTGES